MRIWTKIGLGVVTVLLAVGAGGVALGWYLSAPITAADLARHVKSDQFRDGKFVNIEPEAALEITWASFKDEFFGDQQRVPVGSVPVVDIAPDRLRAKPAPGLRLAWLGHASVLVEIDGMRILTDPMLSERASPFQFAGPKRFHRPPIKLSELAGIDAVVVSHNHYDHLDEATVRHLAGQGTRFFVPLGNRRLLLGWGVPETAIVELDWWQEAKLGKLKITATPARHYSSRGAFDIQETLWASWSIVGPEHRVFYSGDSGYSKVFKQIGARFGPYDASIIKVGSYGPGAYWHDIHMPPEEGMKVHQDVGGSVMLPVHWATFNLARHRWDEPIVRTLKAARKAGARVVTPRIGEFVTVGSKQSFPAWWETIK